MKFKANINIMPLRELLDPQGKTVGKNIGNIGISGIADVRIGKHIELTVEAENQAEAEAKLEKACKELLSNPVMEAYAFVLEPV